MDIDSITRIATPILKKHNVLRASVFGSAVRGEMHNDSDIDFLVELPHNIHGFDYVALRITIQEELEAKLGRKVDLVEYNLIKPALKDYIFSSQAQFI